MSRLVIQPKRQGGRIRKEVYGHFSEHLGRCIYEGLFVGKDSPIPNVNGMRTDVVEALKQIRIPVLRWPGGCFADEYHWKDGIGPVESRKKMVNTHWGGVVEDNSFGTHEFFELCRQLGCAVYINGNVGSGTVQEMAEWVEYMTFDGLSPMSTLRKENGEEGPWKVEFFGVGNENWGCGGNMTPEHYANEYRRYQTYCRNFGDNKLYKIACGANSDDYEWTDTVMKIAVNHMDGLSLHYYTVPGNWQGKGSATEFSEDDWYLTLKKTLHMEELVTRHGKLMDKYDPEKRVGMIVDEWGTWFDVEPGTNPGFLYQQNTMRDALVAGINLNIFNKHCDRVHMANIAQTVNVLQSMVLTEGEKMVLTPSYHVFDLYKYHQDSTLVDSYVEASCVGTGDNQVPNLHESASVDKDGVLHITLNNLSLSEGYAIDASIIDQAVGSVSAQIVTGKMDDYNDFENPAKVAAKEFTDITVTDSGLSFTIPPCSVMHIAVK